MCEHANMRAKNGVHGVSRFRIMRNCAMKSQDFEDIAGLRLKAKPRLWGRNRNQMVM